MASLGSRKRTRPVCPAARVTAGPAAGAAALAPGWVRSALTRTAAATVAAQRRLDDMEPPADIEGCWCPHQCIRRGMSTDLCAGLWTAVRGLEGNALTTVVRRTYRTEVSVFLECDSSPPRPRCLPGRRETVSVVNRA